MKVWIVQESCYHESEVVLGIYSSLRDAEIAAESFASESSGYPCEEIVVIEAEVGKAIEIPQIYHDHAVARVKVSE